ncbi:methyl-CpG-binding domain-containing protein 11-like protein [Cinnamomum micranthum f. kanehirae]|uniref:Methyl-CpG-binding domain-containing protein 11-like protein n=1 Tax=Cinnamomum micranthum f. kanehirae TaxID=337451 RepID=A0A3S3MQ02_9MAGN|nr:methyl-CpG-binding domain-containing protein 11-like protein [Cinnamomum micranthum f. kanehirae]
MRFHSQFTPKKGGTPRRNEVVFISPTGEEIRSKRQLEQYIKSHPGGPSSTEFNWGTGINWMVKYHLAMEAYGVCPTHNSLADPGRMGLICDTPRRSARISEKVKATEAPESELPKKREKTSSLAKAAEEKKDRVDGETKEDGAADGEESKVGADIEMNEADGGDKVDEQVTAKEAAVNAGTVEQVEKEVNQEEAASSNAEKVEEKNQPSPALPSQTEDKERKVEEEQEVEPIVHNADATEENKIGEKGLSENGSHKDNQDWPDATEGPL